jgi:hypothetical protein
MTDSQTRPHVFVSYVREDGASVDRLARDLRRYGVEVWLDRERIRPGYRWQAAIRDAIRDGAMFIACFSQQSARKERSYMNQELALAIDELAQRPYDRVWFIPVVMSGGAVPDRPIGAGETLRHLQWVNLDSDWHQGIRQIVAVCSTSLPHQIHQEGLLPRLADLWLPMAPYIRMISGTVATVAEYVRELASHARANVTSVHLALAEAELQIWLTPEGTRYYQFGVELITSDVVVERLFVISTDALSGVGIERALHRFFAWQQAIGIDVRIMWLAAGARSVKYDWILMDTHTLLINGPPGVALSSGCQIHVAQGFRQLPHFVDDFGTMWRNANKSENLLSGPRLPEPTA